VVLYAQSTGIVESIFSEVGTTSCSSSDMILAVALKFGFGMISGRGRLCLRRVIPTCIVLQEIVSL